MKLSQGLALFASALFATAARTAPACTVLPKDSSALVSSRTVQVLLYPEGRKVHLVARLAVAADKPFSGKIAWVLPLPALPRSYSVVDDGVFDELREAEKSLPGSVRKRPGLPPPPHEQFTAGGVTRAERYEILPIQIEGEDGREIDDFLGARGLSPVKPSLLDPYLQARQTFLLASATVENTSAVAFRPLHVVYEADDLTFAVRACADGDPLDVSIHVAGPGQVPKYTESTWEAKQLPLVSSFPYPGKYKSAELKRLLGTKPGVVTRFANRPAPEGKKSTNFSLRLRSDPAVDSDFGTGS